MHQKHHHVPNHCPNKSRTGFLRENICNILFYVFFMLFHEGAHGVVVVGICVADGFGVVSLFSQLFNFVRRVVRLVPSVYVQYIRKRRSMCVFGVLA